jgi:hypothetical protein
MAANIPKDELDLSHQSTSKLLHNIQQHNNEIDDEDNNTSPYRTTTTPVKVVQLFTHV